MLRIERLETFDCGFSGIWAEDGKHLNWYIQIEEARQ